MLSLNLIEVRYLLYAERIATKLSRNICWGDLNKKMDQFFKYPNIFNFILFFFKWKISKISLFLVDAISGIIFSFLLWRSSNKGENAYLFADLIAS